MTLWMYVTCWRTIAKMFSLLMIIFFYSYVIFNQREENCCSVFLVLHTITWLHMHQIRIYTNNHNISHWADKKLTRIGVNVPMQSMCMCGGICMGMRPCNYYCQLLTSSLISYYLHVHNYYAINCQWVIIHYKCPYMPLAPLPVPSSLYSDGDEWS